MNETIGKICRVCLKTIFSGFQSVDDTNRKMLDKLFMRLNFQISSEPIICTECKRNLQKCFDIKMMCLNVEKGLCPVKINLNVKKESSKEFENRELIDFAESYSVCHFCMKLSTKGGFISLYETKENIYIVDLLKKHIPELNINDLGEFVICNDCLTSLQRLFSFIRNCLDVEEKIEKYLEIKGIGDKSKVELKDVQQFTFKKVINDEVGVSLSFETIIIKKEITEQLEDDKESTTRDVEKTDSTEVVDLKRNIKIEEVMIKSELNENVSFREAASSQTRMKKIYKCKQCTYKAISRSDLCLHKISHKNSSEITMRNCNICPYETQDKEILKKHMLTHINPSELAMYKCGSCWYESKQKHQTKLHMVTHHMPMDKREDTLKLHLLDDEASKDVAMYKCRLCPYESKLKKNIKRHMSSHKGLTVLRIFQCESCSFQTKYRNSMRNHMQSHKNPAEVNVFKCKLCSYESILKRNLNRHMTTHRNPSDIKMFKCNTCLFETKHKFSMSNHLLTHKNSTEVPMFKCEFCSYENKFKNNLTRHMRSHKNPSEIKMFKCETCSFQTKHKFSMAKHLLAYKNPEELAMFVCQICSYQAKCQDGLKLHMPIHRDL